LGKGLATDTNEKHSLQKEDKILIESCGFNAIRAEYYKIDKLGAEVIEM
jgi:hypothetical protein